MMINYIIILLSTILPILCMKEVKLCVNCKHFQGQDVYGRCMLYPKNDVNYLITGEKNKEYFYCSTARTHDNMCSIEGKYYKRKIVKKIVRKNKKV